ncbi:hypothetical protein [Aquabacterium sp.]|uniref:hypothetical protein n=1 Tax=Aquabacterium sp. TaxID=1872578 RepID=UPI002C759C48|nr:hypothetical protein [Aquabacterium sp.]HSW08090.1 hypothetical protein [Aquabacterium sp.]
MTAPAPTGLPPAGTAIVLSPDEIVALSSPYLAGGIRQEAWVIDALRIDGKRLDAVVRMERTFVSPTDAGGFHLSTFIALEFVSQLTVIYAHQQSGHVRKEREVWMLESSFSSRRPVRNPQHIDVRLDVLWSRRRGRELWLNFGFRVSDEHGLFEGTLKAVMP